ncbi:MAG TPA: RNA 2',3'-cyclic phosphodiesterase [Thermomicrobiales bacterium]|nr:RNA 2',3'-cyclic phosphodiesterase [Thermomicrobiales bacterium]
MEEQGGAGAGEPWRLFVAVELSEEARGALAEAQAACRRCALPVRWVDPQGAHLTVKFLGAVEPERVAALTDALATIVTGHRPFLLWTGPTGAFPSPRRPRVLWLGVTGPTDCLDDLQQDVEFALHGLGFPLEGRPFRPHLTLGRVRDGAAPDAAGLTRALEEARHLAPAPLPVRDLRLMRSELGRGGPRYTTLAVAHLDDNGH